MIARETGVPQSWVMEGVYKGQEVRRVGFSTHPIINDLATETGEPLRDYAPRG